MKLYRALKIVEEEAKHIGLRFSHDPYHYDDRDVICLQPSDDQLPIYSRDAIIFVGDHNEVSKFLSGVRWAREYDVMIKAMPKNRRERFETKEVARLKRIVYNKDKAETFKTLKKEHI